ncbi:hypothetical protein C8R48DRAFT_245303 [Suillus tomentosus]|nr:hypothetical protein C8R48DRAFT_245303 [Suillus tomentosus]
MIFTSRFTILALLILLAGVNAECAVCQEGLYVDGVLTYKLVEESDETYNGFKKCTYVDKKNDMMTCECWMVVRMTACYMMGVRRVRKCQRRRAMQDVMSNRLDERINIGQQKVEYIDRFRLRQKFSSYVFRLDQFVAINRLEHLETMSAPPGLSVSVSNSNLGESVHSLFGRTSSDRIETKIDARAYL